MKKMFFSWLENHFKNKSNSVLLLCDLGYPEALDLMKAFPQRVLNVGVSEQNAALVAKGLCAEGFEVFIYGISSFTLWRCAEVLKLYFGPEDSLRIIGNGGGLGYGLMGTTHHSIDDLGLVSLWPTWTSWIPARDQEVPEVLTLLTQETGPQYLRLTNNAATGKNNFEPLRVFSQGDKLTVVTVGPMVDLVLEAAHQETGVQTFCIGKWPVDIEKINQHFAKTGRLLFIEEHQEPGSLSSQIKSQLDGSRKNIRSLTLSKSNIAGSRDALLKMQGLDKKSIASHIVSMKNRVHDKD
ncbi:MAG: hypothetical protein KUL82_00135 [Bdellovibrio sp.]|nr:hypothetical protein [Bdellovibrio sp.]